MVDSHKINNHLAVIVGYSEILLDRAEEKDRKLLKEILEAAICIDSLMRKNSENKLEEVYSETF